MPYFTPELFRFLTDLRRHNNRRWFERNKDRYEEMLRGPAVRFIADFGLRLHRISPNFVADARPHRGSLFRIYRDTRFSADKKPYKTHAGMHFSYRAAKDIHVPGYYLHLEPGESFVAAGIWRPDSPTTTRIRQAIVARPDEWRRACRRLELEGDTLARPPRGFPCDHPLIEDLKFKDFLVSASYTDRQVCSADFFNQFTKDCRRFAPFIRFLCEALDLPF